jgi:hypothetical protein
VGLASARFEGFERCEHVRSVLELLAKHPAASVGRAVAEVLGAERLTSKRPGTK